MPRTNTAAIQQAAHAGDHEILGGAALTRRFVETDCRDAYTEPLNVHYAKDAFAGLRLMDQIVTAKPALAAA